MGGLASSVGSMVGIGGSAAAQGMNWSPTGVALSMPVTQVQAEQSNTGSQNALAQQQSFLNALQGQNGIQNQSNVFNQMQGIANGTGPNPAQAMLAQSTGANTANQAALMAGQRGAGANTGLIARQAAQQGGANQQAAAGQAATMQAQQSLGALGQLSGIAGEQVGQQAAATGAVTGAQQQQQAMLLNQINAQNNASVQQQSAMNTLNAGQAAQGAKAQAGVINGIGGMIGLARGGRVNASDGFPPPGAFNTEQDTTSSAVGDPNDKSGQLNPSFGNTSAPATPKAPSAPKGPQATSKKQPTSSAPLSAQDQLNQAEYQSGQSIGKGLGAGIAGVGSAIKGLFGSSSSPDDAAIPQSGYNPSAADIPGGNMAAPAMSADFEANAGGGPGMAHGGKVPAMVSPGERYLPPKEVEKVAKGKDPLKAGEKIPGKAKVKGDSLKNDTVPKTLEEGGIVLPKSVMEAKHPHWEAHKFVSAILAEQGLGKKRA